jgi:hypothetical protein
MRVAVALLVLTAASVALRTGALDTGFWIDEAIAVGIASHDIGEIPTLLRLDGSPPLYYLLLHEWMTLVGDGEAATRALSLLFAAATVPAAWWAAGRRAAAIVAICPFLTYYAQEARMFTLVAILSLVATAAFMRRRPVVFVGAMTLLLYTHTWAVFLFAGFALVSLRRGWITPLAVVALLYAPWVPSLVFQALHTAAPWSLPPSALVLVPAALAVAWRPRDELVLAGAAGLALAWLASQIEPAWSPRYLFVLFGPLLLVVARHNLAVIAALAAALVLVGPMAKSNARAVAVSAAQSIRPGDLVVVTQPEQVPVLDRYLPEGVAYLTPLGAPADPSMTDWRDALRRVRRASAGRILVPRLRALAPGRRVVLVAPVTRSRSPWARAVRRRTREWRAVLRAELQPLGATSRPDPARFRSTVRAEIFEVVR